MFPYACALCGAEVKVTSAGVKERACGHATATVIAERTSNLYGEGHYAQGSLTSRALAALRKLVGSG